MLSEILEKAVFRAENLKLTALLTLDFEAYVESAEKAHASFFKDGVART